MSTIDADNDDDDDMGNCHICFYQEKDNNEIISILFSPYCVFYICILGTTNKEKEIQ
jgi:hypothetical protein